ncbi:hypothetical protein HJG60_008296 [Phyllostomus discolor]|uniref:Uncharacterized protein n=1 Tax=Phyllostomus discolor TaxID=89673 RepID=A0A833ZCG7_9CHIR|nr:hypothetical protein HJG60_008296 [Phyllostomus discolor]
MRLFGEAAGRGYPGGDCGRIFLPTAQQPAAGDPTRRFQHLQARTATPGSAPGNFRVPEVYAGLAEAKPDWDEGCTHVHSPDPSPSSDPSLANQWAPFLHFKSVSSQTESQKVANTQTHLEAGRKETPKRS